MSGRTLLLIPIGLPAEHLPLLHWLGTPLGAELKLTPVLGDPLELRPEWGDTGGRRFSSNALTDALVELHSSAEGISTPDWVLGVTAVDLFAPGRPFVFGEATLGGGWAVISLARLIPEPDDPERLRRRLLKEALHELGHLRGLRHCPSPGCVMQPSASPAEVDQKSARFCHLCNDADGSNHP